MGCARRCSREKHHGYGRGRIRAPADFANLISQGCEHGVDAICDSLGAYMLIHGQEPVRGGVEEYPNLWWIDIAGEVLHAPRRDTGVWVKKQVPPMRYFAKVSRTLLKANLMLNDLGGSDSQQSQGRFVLAFKTIRLKQL